MQENKYYVNIFQEYLIIFLNIYFFFFLFYKERIGAILKKKKREKEKKETVLTRNSEVVIVKCEAHRSLLPHAKKDSTNPNHPPSHHCPTCQRAYPTPNVRENTNRNSRSHVRIHALAKFAYILRSI